MAVKHIVRIDFDESDHADEVPVQSGRWGPSLWFTDLVKPVKMPARAFLTDGTYANEDELMAVWRESLP